MSEILPRPNREITDEQKELFVTALTRNLGDYLVVDLNPDEFVEAATTETTDCVTISKSATFSMHGATYEVDTVEVIDDISLCGEPSQIASWSLTYRPKPISIDDATLITQQTFMVDSKAGLWIAEYEEAACVTRPGKQSKKCLSDFEIAYQAFWRQHPDKAQQATWRALLEEECEENDSEKYLDTRFTQARLARILPLIIKLQPKHIIPDL